MCEMFAHMPQGVLLSSVWGREGFVIEILEVGKEFRVEWLADLCGGVMVGVASDRVGFWGQFNCS